MRDSILVGKIESTRGVEARPTGADAVLIETPNSDEIRRSFIPATSFMADVHFSSDGRTFRFAPQPGMTPEESTWINLLFIGAATGQLRNAGAGLTEWLAKKNILRHFEVT